MIELDFDFEDVGDCVNLCGVVSIVVVVILLGACGATMNLIMLSPISVATAGDDISDIVSI